MTPEIKKRIEDINNGVLPEGYKKTNIGIIPKEWAVVPLSKIMHNEQRPIDKPDKPYTRIGIRSHAKGTFHELVEDPSTVNMDTLYVVKKDDFIVNITFAWEHAIAVADEFDEGKLVSHRFPTYVFDNHIPSYYKYVFSQEMFRKRLELISPGGAGRNRVLNKTDFLNLSIYRPTLDEQQKIATILSTQDKLISLQEQKVESLKKLKKAYMEKMFPKKGSKYPEYRFKGFTDAWEQCKFGDENDLITGYPFESEFFSETGINLIRGMNVKRGYIDLSNEICVKWNSSKGLESYLLEENDIIIQMDGALIGKSYGIIKKSHLPALLVQRVTRARTNNEIADSNFMYQTIQRDFLTYINMNKTETAVPHLSLNDIKNFDIMVPNLLEQKMIGTFFANLDTLITLHQRKLEAEKKKKKALMQLLLTGKVRV